MGTLTDVKDYLASIGVPVGRYSDAALNQAIATEAAAQKRKCRVPDLEMPSSLGFWFRASDLTGLADGDQVTSWTSVDGGSVATPQFAGQPTKRTVAGQTVVRFDGTDNHCLSVTGGMQTFTNAVAGVTLLARVKYNVAPAGTDSILAVSNGLLVGSVRACLRAESNAFKVGGRRLDADAFVPVGSFATSPADQSIHNLAGVLDYAKTTAQIWVDGALMDQSTSFQAVGVSSATNSLAAGLGADPAGVNAGAFDLYECLGFGRALSSAERAAVESYLAGGVSAPDLREALARRVVVNLARRGITLGVVEQGSDGGGPSFIPRMDAEVKRLEAPYRKLVVG